MEKQVFTIEQMKEIESLGIPVKKASMVWRPEGDEMILDVNRHKEEDDPFWKTEEGKKTVRTFTLQDVLEFLPSNIDKNNFPERDENADEDEEEYWDDDVEYYEVTYELCLEKSGIAYKLWEEDDEENSDLDLEYFLISTQVYQEEGSLMNCAFKVLKWVKENGHIVEEKPRRPFSI